MEKLYIAACDDQAEVLNAYSYIIRECFLNHDIPVSLQKFTSSKALAKAMETEYFDLLFLDIEMPGLNGITLAKRLRKVGSKVDIIYISNKDNLVFDVFDVRPYSFIRKSRFTEEIGGVIRAYVEDKLSDNAHKLIISDTVDVVTLDLNKTVYIESAGKVQHACTVGGDEPIVIRHTMQELESKLADKGFIRVHRGFLVNYRYIDAIKDNAVLLTNGGSVPLSRRTAQEVKDKFLSLIKWDNSAFF